MTREESNKAADEMMALLDLAKRALDADHLERALELVAKAHAIADTLPKAKLVLQ